jgi:hypothetical protein
MRKNTFVHRRLCIINITCKIVTGYYLFSLRTRANGPGPEAGSAACARENPDVLPHIEILQNISIFTTYYQYMLEYAINIIK